MKRNRNHLRSETVAMLQRRDDVRPSAGWVPDHRADPHAGDLPRLDDCDGRGCDHDRCETARLTMDRQRTFIDLAGPSLTSVFSRSWAPETAVRL